MCRWEVRGVQGWSASQVFWDAHSWYAHHVEVAGGWVLARNVVVCRTEAASKLKSMHLQRHCGTIMLSLLLVSDIGIKSWYAGIEERKRSSSGHFSWYESRVAPGGIGCKGWTVVACRTEASKSGRVIVVVVWFVLLPASAGSMELWWNIVACRSEALSSKQLGKQSSSWYVSCSSVPADIIELG